MEPRAKRGRIDPEHITALFPEEVRTYDEWATYPVDVLQLVCSQVGLAPAGSKHKMALRLVGVFQLAGAGAAGGPGTSTAGGNDGIWSPSGGHEAPVASVPAVPLPVAHPVIPATPPPPPAVRHTPPSGSGRRGGPLPIRTPLHTMRWHTPCVFLSISVTRGTARFAGWREALAAGGASLPRGRSPAPRPSEGPPGGPWSVIFGRVSRSGSRSGTRDPSPLRGPATYCRRAPAVQPSPPRWPWRSSGDIPRALSSARRSGSSIAPPSAPQWSPTAPCA